MADRIQKIVTNLPGLKSVTGIWKTAERSLARGDAAFLADLGIALAGAYASEAGRIWQYGSVFDHLLRSLSTTPGPGNVAAALRLVSSTEAADRKLDRYAASLLASSHPVEELAVAFTGNATEELRACLVHEAVLRGADVTQTPGIAGWAMSPHWRHHPLRWLPLALFDVEGQPDLPSYSARGGSHSMPFGSPADRGIRTDAGAHVPAVEETTTEAATKGIGTAVANWAEESNGRIEARVFDLAAPLEAESVPSMLLGLGLECLKGAGKKTAPRSGRARRTRHGGSSSPPRPREVLIAPALAVLTDGWPHGSPWPASPVLPRAPPQRRPRQVHGSAPGMASVPTPSGSSAWPGTSAWPRLLQDADDWRCWPRRTPIEVARTLLR